MRLAAIDIGTNSVHMIIVQVRPDLSFEVIDREKEMVRLGAGGLDGRKLTRAAQLAALQALSKFERLARSHQVDDIIAAATSATREAENGGDFLAAIAEHTGIRARLISGTEEARLIHLAAVYGVDAVTPTVVMDIGGGSVEITLGEAEARLARSFKIGVIRLSERFVGSDPISRRDERKMVRHIGEEVDRYVAQIVKEGFGRLIGTSGTILSLGAVATAIDNGNVPDEVRNLRVSAKRLRKLRKHVTSLPLDERLALPGLDPRRADLIVAGAVLFDTLLSKMDADEVTLCDLALREGLILDYIRRHGRAIARTDQYPDVRRRSAIELAERCQWEGDHARQVAQMAAAIFTQTQHLHGLGDREREWLEYAALLHDIGTHISYERHHRHSYYLIKNGDLRGFEPAEIEIIALVARYHRRATPKKDHEGYGDLTPDRRRTVRLLGAILRVAETLDRSRHGVVTAVTLRDRGTDLRLQIEATGDAELELWASRRQLDVLAAELGKPIALARLPKEAPTPSRARSTPARRRQSIGD
ncbi:MAG: Ppx/GppA family phosphatase [Acidobacteria bacterium]|nr:Ppx/GppA family phosphatase [Acidobacteriota bacterium]